MRVLCKDEVNLSIPFPGDSDTMVDMEPVLIGILAVVLLHFVGGVTAFGSSLLSVAALSAILGVHEARLWVPVLALCGLLQSGFVFMSNYRQTCAKSLGYIIGLTIIGLPIGSFLVFRLSEGVISKTLGLLLILGGILPYVNRLSFRPSVWLKAGILVLSGMVHGALASGGTLLIPYARMTIKEKGAFRGTLAAVWIILNSGVMAVHLFIEEGSFHLNPVHLSALLAGTLVMTLLGQAFSTRLNQQRFFQIASACMILSGCIYIL